jgi:sugar lactone lactonase YvrE
MFARISSIALACILLMALGGVFQANAVEPVPITAELLEGEAGLEYPEDVVFDAEGRLYTGLGDGRIVRFQPDVTQPEVVAQIEGEPLGMRFDAAGNLIVCAHDRLLSITPGGSVTVLTSGEVDGVSLGFINSVGIAADGTMYFSNSTAFPDSVGAEVMEGRPAPRGHLLAYDPQTGTTRVLLDGLWFANGVAMSPDGSFVLVAECTGLRVTRYWLNGAREGESDIFIENLPSPPDNISSNGKGMFWIACPFHGFVLGLDLDGNLVRHLSMLLPSGEPYAGITGVCEHEGMLYLSNHYRDDGIGRALDILTAVESRTWGQVKALFQK